MSAYIQHRKTADEVADLMRAQITEHLARNFGNITLWHEDATTLLDSYAALKAHPASDEPHRAAMRADIRSLRDRAERSEARITTLQADLAKAREDTARMDWLEYRTVNVREPLVHGSRNLFWTNIDTSFEGEEGPSDIRAKIDAALNGERET